MIENEKNRTKQCETEPVFKTSFSVLDVSLDRSLNVVGISGLHFGELTVACLCVPNT